MKLSTRLSVSLLAGAGLLVLAVSTVLSSGMFGFGTQQADDPDGLRAFATVASVLRHPRCLNCHPSGDRPHIGEDGRIHGMNVQRGPDGHGMPGLKCTACHRPSNQDLAGIPGAPHWHLAPRSMGWVGLDDHQLANALKDRSKNGDRSFEKLVEHMADDPLVGWAWAPGADRAPPPVSREAFVAAFKHWIETGAKSPPPGTTTY